MRSTANNKELTKFSKRYCVPFSKLKALPVKTHCNGPLEESILELNLSSL
jgi:hypothetical protein